MTHALASLRTRSIPAPSIIPSKICVRKRNGWWARPDLNRGSPPISLRRCEGGVLTRLDHEPETTSSATCFLTLEACGILCTP